MARLNFSLLGSDSAEQEENFMASQSVAAGTFTDGGASSENITGNGDKITVKDVLDGQNTPKKCEDNQTENDTCSIKGGKATVVGAQFESTEPMSKRKTGKSVSKCDLDVSSPKALEKDLCSLFAEHGLEGDVAKRLLKTIARDEFNRARNISRDLPTNLSGIETIPKWSERKRAYGGADSGLNALEFYRKHWKKYADAGLLYQTILTEHDYKLLPAVRSFCSTHKLCASEHVPPTTSRYIDDQVNSSGLTEGEIIRCGKALESRTRRRSPAP